MVEREVKIHSLTNQAEVGDPLKSTGKQTAAFSWKVTGEPGNSINKMSFDKGS
jgi:hypothetical protein